MRRRIDFLRLARLHDENAGRARPAIAQQGSPGTRPDTVADRRGRSSSLINQTRHDGLARAWVVRQQKSQWLARRHFINS